MIQPHPQVATPGAGAWRLSLVLVRLVVGVLVPRRSIVEVDLTDSPRRGANRRSRGSGWVAAFVATRVLGWRLRVPVGLTRWGGSGASKGPSKRVAARQLITGIADALPDRQLRLTAGGWFGEAAGRAGRAQPLPANVMLAAEAHDGPAAPAADSAKAATVLTASAAMLTVIVTALAAIGIDQLTKELVLNARPDGVPILGGLFYLDLTFNSGAAFSFGSGYTWVFPIVAMIVTGIIVWMARSTRSRPWAIALGLIAGGAIGNLIDRLFRAPGPFEGHVVDFISIFAPNAKYFPIWNMADTALTIGVGLAILLEFTGRRRDGTRASEADDARPGA